MNTPDEEVAARIIEKFREAGLLSGSELTKLYPKLVAGKLKAEDWRFALETHLPDVEDADDAQG